MQVDMSRHVKLVADVSIADVMEHSFDAIALPVRSVFQLTSQAFAAA